MVKELELVKYKLSLIRLQFGVMKLGCWLATSIHIKCGGANCLAKTCRCETCSHIQLQLATYPLGDPVRVSSTIRPWCSKTTLNVENFWRYGLHVVLLQDSCIPRDARWGFRHNLLRPRPAVLRL